MSCVEPGTPPISVAVVNDYELVLAGITTMLRPFADRISIVETDAGGTAHGPCDIALFDTFAARRSVLDRVRAMAADRTVSKIVLYTWDVPRGFDSLVDPGPVDAVVLKTTTGIELVEALEAVHCGEPLERSACDLVPSAPTLSEREREILALLGRGLTNAEIGEELYLSVNTVKTHVSRVFDKLAVNNRTQAAKLAIEHGLTQRVL
jgi:DNA-binding NarL/FixJ family response regulator